jgi:hypothetical protein
LNGSTGVISGTPSTANAYNFTVRCTGANNQYSEKAFGLTINSAPTPPTITTGCPLPAGTVGAAYSQTLAASGGTTPYSWSISSGSLPPGLSLSGGTISGTPTTANPYSFTIRCTGANSLYADKSCSLTVNIICNYLLSPTSANFGTLSGSGSFTVTTQGTCSWSASTGTSWLHTSSSGSGNGAVNYTFDANSSTSGRSGTISVGGQNFTVNQDFDVNPITTGSNLLGYWKFDEGIGSIANDSSENGNSGTISNATWATGFIGSALSFNGANRRTKCLDTEPHCSNYDCSVDQGNQLDRKSAHSGEGLD